MKSTFQIVTDVETSEKIRKQCEIDERIKSNRAYRLGKIKIYKGLESKYAVVTIEARERQIEPSDIFFLGLFAANQKV